jgi:putative flavoprotein involved in K+ transport
MFEENKRSWNTIVIGGGQAGLAIGYYLKKLHEDFIIIDASDRIGDSWRNRWDTLRLITPTWANSLPGYPFPSNGNLNAGKDEVANFLESYASDFKLPVLSQTKVTGLVKMEDGYEITTTRGAFTCGSVVVATGSYNAPKLPVFAQKLHPEILQLHSSAYRRPADLPEGDILVVGAGTSGLQIAKDVASPQRKTYVAGNPPFKIPSFILKYFGRQFIWAMNNIMTIKTKPGRKAEYSIKHLHAAAPLVNISLKDVELSGVRHVARIRDVVNGYPVLEDGTVMKVATVIWCTGYSYDFSWINLNDITDDDGFPYTYRGVSKTHKGLYFMGSIFQYALTSSWINGVGRDAQYISDYIHTHSHHTQEEYIY